MGRGKYVEEESEGEYTSLSSMASGTESEDSESSEASLSVRTPKTATRKGNPPRGLAQNRKPFLPHRGKVTFARDPVYPAHSTRPRRSNRRHRQSGTSSESEEESIRPRHLSPSASRPTSSRRPRKAEDPGAVEIIQELTFTPSPVSRQPKPVLLRTTTTPVQTHPDPQKRFLLLSTPNSQSTPGSNTVRRVKVRRPRVKKSPHAPCTSNRRFRRQRFRSRPQTTQHPQPSTNQSRNPDSAGPAAIRLDRPFQTWEQPAQRRRRPKTPRARGPDSAGPAVRLVPPPNADSPAPASPQEPGTLEPSPMDGSAPQRRHYYHYRYK